MTTDEWMAVGEFWRGILAAIRSMDPRLRITSGGLVTVRAETCEHATVRAFHVQDAFPCESDPYYLGIATGRQMREELEAAAKPKCWKG